MSKLLQFPPYYEARDTELGHAITMEFVKPLRWVMDAVAIARAHMKKDAAVRDLDWSQCVIEVREEGRRWRYEILIPYRDTTLSMTPPVGKALAC